jgi:osmoprotectant transport system permease protein
VINFLLQPLIRWDWIWDHRPEIWTQTKEHIVLTVIAVGIGLAIATVLSVIALRFRWTYPPITIATGMLYTIPSLALFAFFVPYTGLTRTTAEIALVSYTLLILIRNIVAGIDGVPRDVREAAEGMGFTPSRAFLDVQLPLALPVIIAGIRIATVTVIGLVTVTSLIGQGGLGAFILDGLRRDFYTPLILGAVLSVVLAVFADLLLLGAQRLLAPWRSLA